MLWAACCMGFFGFMRAGEFTTTASQSDQGTCLSVQDVAVNSHTYPTTIKVHLIQSKTDPFRHGVDISWPDGHAPLPSGSNTRLLCHLPICWRSLLCFSRMESHCPGLVAAVRCALATAGVNTLLYSGHSFRVGAATTAARAGLSEATIKMLGRWESAAYERYVRTPRESLAAISRHLSHIV